MAQGELDIQVALDALASGWNTRQSESLAGLTARCPHCSKPTVVVPGPVISVISDCKVDTVAVPRQIAQFKCPGCSGLSVVVSGYAMEADKFGNPHRLVLKLLWPVSAPVAALSELSPTELRGVFDEARQVLAFSPRSAAVLARFCIQYIIRNALKICKRGLFEEISAAANHDLLSRPTKNSLDHVRTIGNWGAHPESQSSDSNQVSDFDQATTLVPVSREEALYTLEVVHLLANDVYVSVAKTAAMSSWLNAKKNSAGGAAKQ